MGFFQYDRAHRGSLMTALNPAFPSDFQIVSCFRGVDYDNFAHPLKFWDESSSGRLWLCVNENGPLGIVHANSYEDAHSCYVDELALDADENDPENFPKENKETGEWTFNENVTPRGNGAPEDESLTSHLAYLSDHDMLLPLSADVQSRHHIIVVISYEYESYQGETVEGERLILPPSIKTKGKSQWTQPRT